MNTIKEIENYLSDYFKRGNSMGIDELLDIQDRLSIHSYRLAEMTSTAKSEYNGLYFVRKITINRSIQSLIKSGLSKAAATVQADSDKDAEQRVKGELEAEAEAYKFDMLLNQVNKILSAMQQRISYLKKEHENKI